MFHLDRAHIQTLMYLKLSVAGHLTIFLTRTRGPFWSIRPARVLWVAVLGTQIVATLIAVYGLFMTPLGWGWAAFVWGYALAWFLVNDRVKLLAYRVLDRAKPPAAAGKPLEPRTADRHAGLQARSGGVDDELRRSVQGEPGSHVKLADIDPGFKDHHESHKKAADEIEQDQKKLRALQDLFYADGRYSLLICLQALDTGGKDGTINHVLGAMNPQGCRVARVQAAVRRGARARLLVASAPSGARAGRGRRSSTARTTRTCSSSASTTWSRRRSGRAATTRSTRSSTSSSRTTPTSSSSISTSPRKSN